MNDQAKPKPPPRSFKETLDEQAEFEEHLEEEHDDWQAAVDDERRGKKPAEEPDRSPSYGP
jgi:hypothetical protein